MKKKTMAATIFDWVGGVYRDKGKDAVDAGSVTSQLRVCAMHRNALKCAEIPACAGMR